MPGPSSSVPGIFDRLIVRCPLNRRLPTSMSGAVGGETSPYPYFRDHVILRPMVIVNTLFEERVDQLFLSMRHLHQALDNAGIPYEIIGGLATFIHLERVDPALSRLTRDIDAIVRRADLGRIREAVQPFGLIYRHVAGVDMLVDAENPKAKTAIHLLMAGEKVRPDSPAPTPELGTGEMIMGARIASIDHLLTMKLTSFRLKDKVHIQDLDGVGLITPEIEAGLSELLRARLAEVRASD